jgi:hypothetical protein
MANYIFSDEDSAVIGIAYGGGKFVAVGNKAEMGYSTDGVTWTAVEQSPFGGAEEFVGIAYGGDKFVAVASKYVDKVLDNKMVYSTDGVTWTVIEQSVFGEGDPLRGIAYGGGKFVAVGAWAEGKMAYSADGVTWTAATDSPSSNRGIWDIAYGNGKFIAVLGEDKIAYSNNQE